MHRTAEFHHSKGSCRLSRSTLKSYYILSKGVYPFHKNYECWSTAFWIWVILLTERQTNQSNIITSLVGGNYSVNRLINFTEFKQPASHSHAVPRIIWFIADDILLGYQPHCLRALCETVLSWKICHLEHSSPVTKPIPGERHTDCRPTSICT